MISRYSADVSVLFLISNLHFSLPCSFLVLAISCYLCVPDPTDKFCMSNVTNITDCDSLGDLPKGTYDACMKTSLVLDMGGQDISMNSMTCMVKVSLF